MTLLLFLIIAEKKNNPKSNIRVRSPNSVKKYDLIQFDFTVMLAKVKTRVLVQWIFFLFFFHFYFLKARSLFSSREIKKKKKMLCPVQFSLINITYFLISFPKN